MWELQLLTCPGKIRKECDRQRVLFVIQHDMYFPILHCISEMQAILYVSVIITMTIQFYLNIYRLKILNYAHMHVSVYEFVHVLTVDRGGYLEKQKAVSHLMWVQKT